MNHAKTLGLALVALTLMGSPALADTPRSMMLEIHVGPYTPEIDRAFKHSSPYDEIFGDDPMVMFGLHWDYQVFQGFGTIALGGGARIGWADGAAISQDGSDSSDVTSLNIVRAALPSSSPLR